jgi:hypothetical protein
MREIFFNIALTLGVLFIAAFLVGRVAIFIRNKLRRSNGDNSTTGLSDASTGLAHLLSILGICIVLSLALAAIFWIWEK